NGTRRMANGVHGRHLSARSGSCPRAPARPVPRRAPRRSGLRDAAAFDLSAVRQTHDLPPLPGAGQQERIVTAMAEARAEVERVVRPHGGQVAGDADLRVVEPLDPLVALGGGDGTDELL